MKRKKGIADVLMAESEVIWLFGMDKHCVSNQK